MIGTLVNVGTVIIGASLGLVFKKKMPEKISTTLFQALGIFTIYLGLQMALGSQNPLVLILSLLIGSITGTWMNLEDRFQNMASRFSKSKDRSFTDGIVTAFMVFCVGSLTIVGCLQEGLTGQKDLIYTKSIMDLFSSMALASVYGKGVLFSVVFLFIYQGAITMGSTQLKSILDGPPKTELIATGGLLLIALGLNLLEIKTIKVLNMVPALFFAIVFALIFQKLGFYML